MFWIALLILLVFIAFLLVRESKRRAEWQLEYRYLSRHEAHTEKKNAAAQPVDAFTHGENVAETSRFDADYDVTSENISTNIMGRNKRPVNIQTEPQAIPPAQTQTIATLSQQAAKLAAHQPESVITQAVAESELPEDKPTAAKSVSVHTQALREKWQQVSARVREMAPKPNKRGEVLAAIQQKSSIHADTEPSDDSQQVENHLAQQLTQQKTKWQAEVPTEAIQQEGYALMSDEVEEREWEEDKRAPNWDDDEQLPQEITLAEIEHRRERLRPLRKQETVLQADADVAQALTDVPEVKTIELDDVAHVIRAIKEDHQAPAMASKVIDDEDVAHVIKAIKSDAMGNAAAVSSPLEVIELPEAVVKHEQPAEHLEVIELDWAPRQSEYARRAGIQTKTSAVNTVIDAPVSSKASGISLERPELETIQLEANNYVPRTVAVSKTDLEVIELPSVATKQVLPKIKPTRQTIVLTEHGLETVNEFGEAVESLPAVSGRPAGDDALLKAMVGKANQERLIEDEDIRSNLLRQRMARRRSGTATTADAEAETDVIAEDEVLANLAKTDSPVNRMLRPSKPRPVVRDSVIPPTARIGSEHGFKVKPESLPPAQPISTRFTPYQHPELAATAASTGLEAAVVSAPVAASLQAAAIAAHEPVATLVAATPSAWVDPNTLQLEPELTLEPELESLPTNNVYSSRGWTQPIELAADLPVLPEIENDFEFFDMDAPLPEQAASVVSNVNTAAQVDSFASVAATTAPIAAPSKVQTIVPTAAPAHSAAWENDSVMLPNVQLLQAPIDDTNLRPDDEVLINNGIIIEEKLAEFKVNVSVTDAYAGPVITRYEIEPATGVRGSQVVNLEKDLARSLGFASIRVVETIPGKTCMGLELPNPKRQMIRLSSIFQAPVFQESKSKLTMALGQDISGNPVVTDLAKAPHLLVAGTTGSGKSVGVNAMILSMLFKATPEEVRMIMIDPKMLELSIYEGIPHLLAPVVTDMKLAANALNWCVNEMEKRYRLMSHMGVRNLAGYNQKIADAKARGQTIVNPFSITPDEPDLLEKLPFIVVVVDEFADLMMTAGKKIEELIARLAQKARAAGIHLILATQRPSVDVITGLIKANIPTRIAFQVSSKIDSRTILDQMGAENLLGQGDMLFLPPGTGYPRRIHGAFVADDEVHNVVEYLKQFGEPDYVEDILSHGGLDDSSSGAGGNGSGEEDALYDQAVKYVISSGKTSISAVQRQMRIGYNRAARLVDQMEAAGVLSAPEHNGNRSLLVPQREM